MTCGVNVARYGYPPGYDSTTIPLLQLWMSNDNGATWTEVVLSFFTSELAVWQTTLVGTVSISYFNDLWTYARFTDVEISGSSAILSFFLPSLPTVFIGQSTRFSVVKARLDFASGALSVIDRIDFYSLTSTDYTYIPNSYPYWERGMLAVEGGIMIMRPSDPTNYLTTPFVFGISPDGTEPTGFTEMPWPACYTGNVMWFGANKLAVPVYDGTYGLYTSTNAGQSWTRTATISPDTTPPPVYTGFGQNSTMKNFGELNWLRTNGNAVSATPYQPWLSDDRITPP